MNLTMLALFLFELYLGVSALSGKENNIIDDDELSSDESEEQSAEDGYSGSGEFDISSSDKEDSLEREVPEQDIVSETPKIGTIIAKEPKAKALPKCGCSLCYLLQRGCCIFRGQNPPRGYIYAGIGCCGRRVCYVKRSMRGRSPQEGKVKVSGASTPCSSTRKERGCESHCRDYHGGICCGSNPGQGYYFSGQQDCCQHGSCYVRLKNKQVND